MEATTATNVVHPPKFAKRRRRMTRYAVGQIRHRDIKATKQQTMAAGFQGTVAAVLIALSLHHLAVGIGIVTNAPVWECWALAIGFDLGFVAFELAKVLCREKTREELNRLLNTAITCTLVGSAILNAFAFGSAAVGVLVYPAVALGLSIPAMIYGLTRAGCKAWIDR